MAESTAGEVSRRLEGFDARYLGAAALPVLLENFRRISLPTSTMFAEVSEPHVLVLCFALAAALCAAVIAGLDVRGRMPGRTIATSVGLALVLAILVTSLVAGPWGHASPLAGCLAFVVAGCLASWLWVAWLSAFAKAPAGLLPIYCGLTIILGKAMRMWFVTTPGPEPMVASAVLSVVAASSVLLVAWLESDADVFGHGVRDLEPLAPVQAARFSLNVAAVGFIVSWFTKGVLSVPPEHLATNHNLWVPVIEALVCALALVVIFMPRGVVAKYDVANDRARFAAPVLAVCMVYFCFIRMLDAGGALKTLLSLIGDSGSVGFALMYIYLAALGSAERGVSAASQVAPVVALACIAYLGGTVAYALAGNLAMYVQIVIITSFLLGITAGLVRRATTGEEARRAKRVEALAAKWGLSAREAEIVALMAADYSNAAIAETLVISPETVRTHQKRIYGKAGIHKREDLVREIRNGGSAPKCGV